MDPYKPPFPAKEAKTSEQRKEWLAWYFSTMDARKKQSDQFYNSAGFSLCFGFAGLCIVPLVIAVLHAAFGK